MSRSSRITTRVTLSALLAMVLILVVANFWPQTGGSNDDDAWSASENETPFKMANYIADIQRTGLVDSSGFPHYAGGVFLVTQNGKELNKHVTGSALLYADRDGKLLPENQQIATKDTSIGFNYEAGVGVQRSGTNGRDHNGWCAGGANL